ncbi:hypothetical protein BO94DRAFT_181241 [Aspergillus sclerotioniger CBS 115572]|uniref:Uncharacterized protein n=1 Tax=Aspergillus sclerotioniger CBS 115572 TaxID=1450535 RepID=A0A317VXL8_9EURO|nr:hypothetical protein BO94DRAFT_181241 [Aspergillus sclerotioniger CBS 115572]PWY78535.1 hypothetical protein BO94DRAFT_181241 [Aspergillus sclerotioniger CBS 115572]
MGGITHASDLQFPSRNFKLLLHPDTGCCNIRDLDLPSCLSVPLCWTPLWGRMVLVVTVTNNTSGGRARSCRIGLKHWRSNRWRWLVAYLCLQLLVPVSLVAKQHDHWLRVQTTEN